MDAMFDNRRITRSLSSELRRATQPPNSCGPSDGHFGSANHSNFGGSSVYSGYNQNEIHPNTIASKDRDAATPTTSSVVCRNTSEEIFLQNIMDASMAVPSTPSIEGFMSSPALNRISSEDLFQNMLANTAEGFGQSPAPPGYRPRQNSRRMSSELAALLAQQNGSLFPRIDSGEFTILNQALFNDETPCGDSTNQQKASNKNCSADRPPTTTSQLKNIPWFHHPSPIMTRSRSSELRRMAADMQGLPFPPTAESLQRLASHATNDHLNQHHSGTAWPARNGNLQHRKPPAPPHYHPNPPLVQSHNHSLPPLPENQLTHHSHQSGHHSTSHLHQNHLLQSQQPEMGSSRPIDQQPNPMGPSSQSALYHQNPNLNPPTSSPLSNSDSLNDSGFAHFGKTAGESSFSAVVGLLKGSIERKKQQANMRDVDGVVRNVDSKPVVGANHVDMIHPNSDLVPQGLPGSMSRKLLAQVGGDGGGRSLDLPEDSFSPNRQLQVPPHLPPSDVTQPIPSGCDFAGQSLHSPHRSYGEVQVTNALNGVWPSPATHAPSASASSGCGTALSADGPCNSSQTVSTLNQVNTGFQNPALKRIAVGSVDQPAKRQALSLPNGNHLSPNSGHNTSDAGPYDSPRIQDLEIKVQKPNSQLQRAGSVTSSGRSGYQGDHIEDATKKRRVERQRKMAEAKGRCYIPADLQAACKRVEALEKEVRSQKLTLAFMNRKDSEQTKQIEELDQQNKDLMNDKKQLMEELERITSGRNSGGA